MKVRGRRARAGREGGERGGPKPIRDKIALDFVPFLLQFFYSRYHGGCT